MYIYQLDAILSILWTRFWDSTYHFTYPNLSPIYLFIYLAIFFTWNILISLAWPVRRASQRTLGEMFQITHLTWADYNTYSAHTSCSEKCVFFPLHCTLSPASRRATAPQRSHYSHSYWLEIISTTNSSEGEIAKFLKKKHIIFSKHCATFSLLLEDKIIQSVNNHLVLNIFMGMEWGWHALY